MNLFVLASYAILLPSIFVYAGEKEALLFNRIDRSLIYLPVNSSEKNCDYWATACPFENTDIKSVGKAPLLVKKEYDRKDEISKLDRYICEKPFKMSLVFSISSIALEFGYEIYYPAKDDSKYYTSNTANYKTVERATEVMRRKLGLGPVLLWTKEMHSRFRKIIEDEDHGQWHEGEKMNLIWIGMFQVKYDFSAMILTKVVYEIRQKNRRPTQIECKAENYLGNEVYRGEKGIYKGDVDALYKAQKKLFKGFKLPYILCTGESCTHKYILHDIPQVCDNNNPCLMKWPLIPIDQFNLFPSSDLYCSNIITIPIWKTMVEEILITLNNFFYALFQVLRNPIHVVSGTIGQLELPYLNFSFTSRSFSKRSIYLDSERKALPVPRIIYQIIKYSLPKCNLPVKFCTYSAIFLIHNDPYFQPQDKLCKNDDDITEHWGLNGIFKSTSKKTYENIYVCKNNHKVLNRMFGKTKVISEVLDLENFPSLDENGNSINKKDITNEVRNFYNSDIKSDDLEVDEIIKISQSNIENDPEGEPIFVQGEYINV